MLSLALCSVKPNCVSPRKAIGLDDLPARFIRDGAKVLPTLFHTLLIYH